MYTLETYTPEAKLIFPPYIEAAYGEEEATFNFKSSLNLPSSLGSFLSAVHFFHSGKIRH
jgi:hypothetical protein